MEKINVSHLVMHFPQPTGMSCWSAAGTMLFGDRSVGPGGAVLGPTGGLRSDYIRRVAYGAWMRCFPEATTYVLHR